MCVKMLHPLEGETFIDPACGSAGFAVHTIFHAWRRILEDEGLTASHLFTLDSRPPRCADYARDKIFAIDFDEKSVRVARCLNLIAGDGQSNVLHLNTLDWRKWGETVRQEDWQDTYEGWKKLKRLRVKRDDDRSFQFDVLMANPMLPRPTALAGSVRDTPHWSNSATRLPRADHKAITELVHATQAAPPTMNMSNCALGSQVMQMLLVGMSDAKPARNASVTPVAATAVVRNHRKTILSSALSATTTDPIAPTNRSHPIWSTQTAFPIAGMMPIAICAEAPIPIRRAIPRRAAVSLDILAFQTWLLRGSVPCAFAPLAQRYLDSLETLSPRSVTSCEKSPDRWTAESLVFDTQR